jgi:OmpA-OmpF porin, OOP family
MNEHILNLIVSFLLGMLIFNLNAQNLVINPSFEKFEEGKLTSWITLSGSPDIYSGQRNIVPRANDLKKYKLNPFAKKGVNYLGLASYLTVAEAIQGSLTETLKKDSIYLIEMYVIKPKYRCSTSAYEISIGFSNIAGIESTLIKEINLFPVILKSDSLSFLDKIDEWMKVHCQYKAIGNEKHVVIANFTGVNKDVLELPTLNQYGLPIDGGDGCYYYYYDLISIEKLKPFSKINFKNKIIFDGVLFEKNASVINKNFSIKLDNLSKELKSNTSKHIEILGFTDNQGTESYNLELSEKRAKSVYEYLIEKGINPQILTCSGLGESQPISSNDTKEGQKMNRRVEIIIY